MLRVAVDYKMLFAPHVSSDNMLILYRDWQKLIRMCGVRRSGRVNSCEDQPFAAAIPLTACECHCCGHEPIPADLGLSSLVCIVAGSG